MFTPDDLRVRHFRPTDQGEVLRMINYIQGEEENAELRRQIKLMFLNPWLWAAAAVAICVVGISLDIPPVPTSIGFLLLAGFLSKSHFQTYWAEVKTIFNPKSPDLVDIKDFYFDNADVDEEEEEEEGEEDKEKKRRRSRRRRTFLVAEHRGRIVGTTAVREAPGMPDFTRTCKLWRVFVHPATRRMGIATRLVREAARQAREEMGYSRLSLRTHKTNSGSLRLYDSLGFGRRSEDVVAAAFPLKFLAVNYEVFFDKG